jgi:hypothetical protein
MGTLTNKPLGVRIQKVLTGAQPSVDIKGRLFQGVISHIP